VYGERTLPRIDAERALAGLGAGAVGGRGFAADPVDRLHRDAVVDDVDDAADRLAAITQGGRATHHFDILSGQRVDRHAMVGADIRDVRAGQAVLGQLDALGVHAADHRATGAGREARAGHAGDVAQGVGQAGAAIGQHLIAADLLDDRREPVRITAERRGGDHHLRHRMTQVLGLGAYAPRQHHPGAGGRQQHRTQPHVASPKKANHSRLCYSITLSKRDRWRDAKIE
jgi:hypothetical protein